jgi:hypothetical protein
VIGGELVGAVGGEQEERQVREAARNHAQEVAGGRVGPVQVLQQQGEGARRAEYREVGQGAPHDGVLAAQRLAIALGGQDRRRQVGQAVAARGAAEQLTPGAVGRGLGQVVAAPHQHQQVLATPLGQRRLGQGRLADARLAADEHQRPSPRPRRGAGLAQGGQLAIAPDERRGGLVRRDGAIDHRRPRGVTLGDGCRRV